MKYLHPPNDEERFAGSGAYDGPISEQWERHRRPDRFAVWRFEQSGKGSLRLGHLLVNDAGRPERLQIHQRGEVGLQRQTYTFFDNSVIVADNRVAGRQMREVPDGWTLLTPFVGACAFAFPFAPTREEPAEQPVFVVGEREDGLLASRLVTMRFEPYGVDDHTVGREGYTGHGWRLRAEDEPAETLWLTDEGLTLKRLHAGRLMRLTQVRKAW